MGRFFVVSELMVGIKSISQAVPAQPTAGGVALLSGSSSRDQLWGQQKSEQPLIAHEQTSVMPRAGTQH